MNNQLKVGDLVRFKLDQRERLLTATGDPRKIYPFKFEIGIVIGYESDKWPAGSVPSWYTPDPVVSFPSKISTFTPSVLEVL
jgi:hypothetical protein